MTALLSAGVAMTSCHSSSDAAVASRPATDMPGAYRSSLPGPAALPNACIYRTSIDVDAYVPVTVNPVDGTLISYPAPSDITGASMPVVLKDGWLHDLSEAPSPAKLLEAIIPDARVTEIVELPYKIGSVTPAQVDSIIAGGLQRCEVTYKQ